MLQTKSIKKEGTCFTYSVIIPHKNSLNYLIRLVRSIPNRNDLEILVVDDNSDKVTKEDWQQFQADFPHVRHYLTTEGKGAGYARNVGLSHCIGKWVIFADADDFFYPNSFDYLDQWKSSDMDIIYFLCDSRIGDTLVPCSDRMPIIRKFIEQRDIGGLRFNSLVPWGKMIKRSLIEEHHIRFDEIEVSNDVMFSMRVGLHVENAEVINTPLYCCTNNPGSLYFHRTVNRAMIRLDTYKIANDFLHDHGYDNYRLPFHRAAYVNMMLLRQQQPRLFFKYLWKLRYKGKTHIYLKEIASMMRAHVRYTAFKLAKNRR